MTNAVDVALVALRVAIIAVVALLVADPSTTSEEREPRPGARAVLLDASRSMGIETPGETSRFERGRALSAEAARSRFTPYIAQGDTTAATPSDVADAPRGPTRVLAALRELAAAREGAFSDVLVISDGIEDAASLGELDVSPLPFRVHAVLTDDVRPLRDASIVVASPPSVASSGESIRLRFRVASSDAFDGGTLRLERDGEAVAETRIANAREDVFVDVDPGAPGRRIFRATLTQSSADDIAENDEAAFAVDVRRARFRVLLVCGRPSWDQRFLREELDSQAGMELVSFFILRTEDDLTYAAPNELALIPFPTDELFREHLSSFDAIVFQNFDFAPYDVEQYLPRIAKYVREGGGLAMIGGALSFSSGGYSGTPIEDVLPVALEDVANDYDRSSFRATVAAKGAAHPLVALGSGDGAFAWSGVAELAGLHRIRGVHEGSRTLLEARPERGPSVPLLVAGDVGRGRSLALLTDESWRWRFEAEDDTRDPYGVFWERALRWLSRDPALDASRLEVAARVLAGEAFEVRGFARNAAYEPLSRASVSLVDGQGAVLTSAEPTPNERGEIRWTVRAPTRPGVVRAELRERAGGEVIARLPFVVDDGRAELDDTTPRRDFLDRLVATSGGTWVDGTDFEASVARATTFVKKTRVTPRVPRGIGEAVLLVLLAAEWVVRRKNGKR